MDFSQILGGLFGAGAQGALANFGINQIKQSGTDTQNMLSGIAEQARGDLQFKPYTVTTGGAGGGLGSFTGGPGGTSMNLSPDYQALVQQLTSGGMGQLMGAAGPIDERAGALTAQMEAASAPSRERERIALEERLLGQGRLGMQTAQYGGTSEQFALAKAIEEQRSQNALMGRNQAMGEQLQQYNIGQGLFNAGFQPQDMLLKTMGATAPFADIATAMQRQSAFTNADLARSGAESATQSEQMANMLRQTYMDKALQGLMAPQYGKNGDPLGSIWGSLFDKAGGLFGGGNSSGTDAYGNSPTY